jgi:signal transduction histidine kinase
MLHDFLLANRDTLLDRCKTRIAQRATPKAATGMAQHGIPLFLDQLIRTLEAEEASQGAISARVSGASGGKVPERSEIGASAARHARELSQQGFSFDQMVRTYGDICQAITELAVEETAAINAVEFKTLNRCLDNAIADAVTEFAYQQESLAMVRGSLAADARQRALSQELRNHLQSATLAIAAIKTGDVGLNGVTGSILDLSLAAMRNVLDRPVPLVAATVGLPLNHRPIGLADFITEIKTFTAPEALARRCVLTVPEVDAGLAVDADRDMLFSVVGSLLENAFRFTHPRSEVVLSAYSAGDHILIDVADNCGGLAPDGAEKVFLASKREDDDRPAFRHGLAACRRLIGMNGGALDVRDAPGTGCIFTIKLPRYAPAAPG